MSKTITESGITTLKFEHGSTITRLWIGSRDQWEAEFGSRKDNDGWDAQYLEDGRVIAIRSHKRTRDDFEDNRKVGYGPWPESVTALRRLRSLVMDAIEQDDDVTGVRVVLGGDGQAEFGVTMADRRERKGRALPESFYVRMTFHNSEWDAW